MKRIDHCTLIVLQHASHCHRSAPLIGCHKSHPVHHTCRSIATIPGTEYTCEGKRVTRPKNKLTNPTAVAATYGAAADPRVQLVGYGPSASTIGGNRAGRAAATAVRRHLQAGDRASAV